MRIIDRLREKVRSGAYVLSYHAIDEMRDDEFEEEDFEAAILSGRVIRVQKDRLARRKYTVEVAPATKDPCERYAVLPLRAANWLSSRFTMLPNPILKVRG